MFECRHEQDPKTDNGCGGSPAISGTSKQIVNYSKSTVNSFSNPRPTIDDSITFERAKKLLPWRYPISDEAFRAGKLESFPGEVHFRSDRKTATTSLNSSRTISRATNCHQIQGTWFETIFQEQLFLRMSFHLNLKQRRDYFSLSNDRCADNA